MECEGKSNRNSFITVLVFGGSTIDYTVRVGDQKF